MLIRHDFGPEGVAYVRSYLERNDRFGRRLGSLLAGRDIEAGTTWAFVPAASSPRWRVDFEHGGLFPHRGPPVQSEDGVLVPVFDPSLDPQITAGVAGLFSRPSASPRLLCVEQAYARRTDPWLAERPDEDVFFYGDDVYAYATADAPIEQATRLLGGATWQPNVGIVTVLPDGLQEMRKREPISPEALGDMAAAAIAIVVGAWDGEGLLFWEPEEGGDSADP